MSVDQAKRFYPNSLAMFPPPDVPAPGDFLLITDELASPADFLLHRYLASHLRDSEQTSRCIVLSVSDGLPKWKAIASKSNVTLWNHMKAGTLEFVDVAPFLQDINSTVAPLKPIFEKVRGMIDNGVLQFRPTLVIIDDISSLEWIGVPTQDISLFVRALCAVCRKANVSLIIRHHNISPLELDDTYRQLLQLCSHHIDVFPLSTGRSGAVSGQIALHPGPGQVNHMYKPICRSTALHYRLTDASYTFFERGTGGAVL